MIQCLTLTLGWSVVSFIILLLFSSFQVSGIFGHGVIVWGVEFIEMEE